MRIWLCSGGKEHCRTISYMRRAAKFFAGWAPRLTDCFVGRLERLLSKEVETRFTP